MFFSSFQQHLAVILFPVGSRTVAAEVAQIIKPSLQKTKKWRINAFLNADYAITDILPDWIFAATLWTIISGHVWKSALIQPVSVVQPAHLPMTKNNQGSDILSGVIKISKAWLFKMLKFGCLNLCHLSGISKLVILLSYDTYFCTLLDLVSNFEYRWRHFRDFTTELKHS